MKVLQPRILPEDIAPLAIQSCRSCELCRHKNRLIWGEGNPKASILVVLDNPGAREDKDGKHFLCGTRGTLQKAAYEVGLSPNDFYITFILKCRPRKAYDKPIARSTCIKYLWDQLKTISPEIVLCLGNIVCQTFFEDPTVEVKKIRGRIHQVRGYSVVASYHPLAVRRRPVLYKLFVADWELAARR